MNNLKDYIGDVAEDLAQITYKKSLHELGPVSRTAVWEMAERIVIDKNAAKKDLGQDR